ncbi:MAG: PLP-dependent aminotransferase family protein [Betaproteobacteria bacterium]|nr:PLP-dependent aminotransferase family protein [Betaproteobacteria bacterium]
MSRSHTARTSQTRTDWLARRLRASIRRGVLAPGKRLPSSREYSRTLGLGRNTVLAAFGKLIEEGWLVARHGSGTYVADPIPVIPAHARRAPADLAAAFSPTLSRRGMQLASTDRPRTTAFAPGVPDVSEFPFTQWLHCLQRASRRVTPRMLNYGQGGGLAALREALCQHLALTRGVLCDPGDIIITSGTADSLLLCATLFAEAGDGAVVEQPGYSQAAGVLRSAGLAVSAVSVDAEGLDPLRIQTAAPPRVLYFTPCRQYPLGHELSMARRAALSAWAQRYGAVLLEDDYDSEFVGSGEPRMPMRAAPGGESVVLLGSFSKIMFPGLRIAYVVMPHALAAQAQRAAARLFMAARPWEQLALAEFITSGRLRQHLLRMRASLARKHGWFRQLWQKELGDVMRLAGDAGALHGVAMLPPGGRDQPLVQRLREAGFAPEALSSMCLERPRSQGLVIGHGSLSMGELKRLGPRLVHEIAAGLRARA